MTGHPQATRQILVADDNKEIRNLLWTILTRARHSVVLVENGAHALEECGRSHFALIILDNEMGRPTGLEVISRLRDRGDVTPIIFMSGTFSEDILVRAAAFPAVTCIAKPFGIAEFEAVVTRAMGTASG
jgi:CheY-like chemotaxis protein